MELMQWSRKKRDRGRPPALDEFCHKVLRTIIERFDGGPAGLNPMAESISEEADTIMDIHELYLMQVGFLQGTPRGRVVTLLACERLGLPRDGPPPSAQAALWAST